MHENKNDAPTSKVFYRPIEASIRWAGLLRYEQVILASVSSPRNLPQSLDCPRWGELRLYTDRIYDGILNGELPFGQNGITARDIALIESPDLTVRHVDLKRWMRQHYPEQRPGFLFCRSERIAHPFISLETGQAMLVERLALKSALEQCKRQLRELQDQHDALLKQSTVIPACAQCPISDRAEATYPRGGFLHQTDDHKAGAVVAQRAGDVVTRRGQIHVYQPLLANSRPGYWPAGALMEGDASTGKWQELTPVLSSSCTVFPRSGFLTQAQQGDYAWALWRPYACCERRGQVFLGSVDFY